ncbi:MAG: polyprenyl synthetase family protein [Desulfobulbus sp.]|nr:polyprenyl synthetase family protein [Desulfobulbus sp.]
MRRPASEHSNAVPADCFADLHSTLATVVARVETAMRTDLEHSLDQCDPLLIEVVHYSLFNGGKRIRPLLTVLCSRSCGRDDGDLYLLAGAFEYLHVATLIHDDIIDQAAQRRGKKTVVARYGKTAAILAGDWLHARSMHLVGKLAGPDSLEVFCRATQSMVNGEFEQLRHIGDISTSKEQYLKIIRQKTGNLIASTCVIGALYAGADRQQQHALRTYGSHIGEAFQIVDDLLDFQGNAAQTGKQIGNDFVEGKITLPLLYALAEASPADKEIMKELIEGDRTQPSSYEALVANIERYNGFNLAAGTARQLISTAIEILRTMPVHEDGGQATHLLQRLASYLLTRKR